MEKTSKIRLAIIHVVELRLVTDTDTDRHRATASTRASIASPGYKHNEVVTEQQQDTSTII